MAANDVVAEFVQKPAGDPLIHGQPGICRGLTHGTNDFSVRHVVGDDFCYFWEMPIVPFLDTQ